MTTAVLAINNIECSVLNPTSFIVPKSKSLTHVMCAPLFGDLHLFLRTHTGVIDFFSSMDAKKTTIDGEVSVYVTSKSKTIKVYDIEFIAATLEVLSIHYSQEEKPVLIELYLKPNIQRVGKVIMKRGQKNTIKPKY